MQIMQKMNINLQRSSDLGFNMFKGNQNLGDVCVDLIIFDY